MSLQLVANHLAQKGRGPDSTLVHMSNREVAGLQALAQKHGGQLSVNPETGLPEAGFLDNILPMVAGAGLTYLSGGAIDPMMAGGIIGGITALDSKDLSKGLTAGLGAWGGAGMVGGLAGLGAAGADTAAMAVPEYQTAVGTGAGQFVDAPMKTLSTLGGGSALKGGLPILAGLAPAAAEALDEEEDDNPPELKKGYIRKYAFDPVTGQYKQVGVYEAGGDPNKDVSSEAGTAGAFGAVGQSEYEKAHGMAEGGTATDSSRIYDYLMGRGPNPMQFTHTQSPQVDYSPYMPKPITPTTSILETVYDPYGNIQRGGGRGEREPEDPNSFSAQWAAMNDAEKEAWRAENPKTAIAQDVATLLVSPLKFLHDKAQAYMRPDSSTGGPARYSAPPVTPNVDPQTFGGYADGVTPNPYSMGPGTPGFNAGPDAKAQQEAGQATKKPLSFFNTIDPTNAPESAFPSGAHYTDKWFTRDALGRLVNPNAPLAGGSSASPNVSLLAQNALAGSSMQSALNSLAQSQAEAQQRAIFNAIQNVQFEGMDRGSVPTAVLSPVPMGNITPVQASQPSTSNEGNRGGGEGGEGGGYSNANAGNYGWARSGGGEGGGWAAGGTTHGGIANLHQYNLGSYSDGGRLLKGPGDGVSDDIPATIGHGQPARLADGEFVIPARIVSEIGNGSTDAGARELYKMMDRIQAGRKKTVGKDQVARNTKAVRHLPA